MFDLAIDYMGVHDTAPATIMTTGTGNDGLARASRFARRFVNCTQTHAEILYPQRIEFILARFTLLETLIQRNLGQNIARGDAAKRQAFTNVARTLV
jgi:hypothetical protein